MEISPEMVREALEKILWNELSFYLEDLMGVSETVHNTSVILTRHCYSFADLPEPKLEVKKTPRP